MAKTKKHLSQLQSELHAITPLTLELVAQRLQEIQNKRLQIDFQPLDSDTLLFKVQYYRRRGKVTASAMGRLLRWQGTQTRVDIDGETHAPTVWIDWALQALIVSIILLPFISILTVIIQIRSFGGMVVAMVIGLLVWQIVSRILNIDLFKDQRYAALKDLDKVMQGIADGLTNGAPQMPALLQAHMNDDLSALLQQDYSRFPSPFQKRAIGSDGELLSLTENTKAFDAAPE